MRTLIAIVLLSFISATSVWATHNRAGEITYEHISGTTYRITITTYTKLSAPADREWMPIDFGDGTPGDSIQRTIVADDVLNDLRYNVYIKEHSFPGPGSYRLVAEDPNRNIGILNLGDSISVNLVFAIDTDLVISPIGGVNNSVQLLNPPLDEGCVYEVFEHNPGAYDPDGDSLVYELVPCLGPGGEPLDIYEDPDQIIPGGNNNISVDAQTGTVTWDSPQQVGLYNIAIQITEYRTNSNGQVAVVGTVLRDMQITIKQCNNQPPSLENIPDTCVEAGSLLNFQVSGSDPNGNPIILSAYGGPLQFNNSPATFSHIPPSNNGTFSWNTNCSHVRLAPYQITFKVEDVNQEQTLSAFETMNITVVAPAPENPEATPQLGAIELSWDESICENATGYKIYRRAGAYGFEPGYCETGVPGYTGYELLTNIDGLGNTSYVDDNDISFGVGYCYMIVACFADGAESYASEEFCAEISAEIPLITHNSVGATDSNTGKDTLRWQRPFDLDTINLYTGPYQYKVYRGNGFNNTPELIYTSPENPVLSALPGQLIVDDIDTESQANTYRVELLNDGVEVSMSNPASSIFLSIEPNDETLNLSWALNQPWVNFHYEVQRLNEDTDEWEFVGETAETEFAETGLENGEEYCYRVIATGSYFNSTFPDTLVNYSQEKCATPFDNTPPCAPETIEQTCGTCIEDTGELTPNVISWSNSNDCEDTDDTEIYYIYYSPVIGEEMMLIDSVYVEEGTNYEHLVEKSNVGCYAVTALDYDEVNNRRNESEMSDMVCCEPDSDYELPNVFTPNNDGKNDLFRPFPYCLVESVDMVIYNRWGQPVFETTDPDILWDGVHMDSGTRVPHGVYYYICVVNSIRLGGIESFELTGTVHLLDGRDGANFK